MGKPKSAESGADLVEFGPGELRLVGGDYGEIVFEGTTEDARRAIQSVIDGVRRGGSCTSINLSLRLNDPPPAVVEDWHAGRERTPEGGVGNVAERSEGAEDRTS